MEELTEIGYVRKTHGYKGVLKINLHDEIDLEEGIQVFFLDNRGERLPYFPESIGFNGSDELLVKLEDVNSSESAALLRGCVVYVDTSKVIQLEPESDAVNYNGYTVHDTAIGQIGPILETLEMPGHDVLTVEYGDRQVLIPIHEELIESVDSTQKIILLNLPEGILDL